ncbi:hypothetical protein HDU88_008330 [Geranomyces variabilis]|nr:hypothetical protein HDU88_008330 [Geranomyces variabilis]
MVRVDAGEVTSRFSRLSEILIVPSDRIRGRRLFVFEVKVAEQAQVAHVTFDFNGSCVDNPGQGGCGAVAYVEGGEGAPLITITDFPGTLKTSTNYIAAYTALLLGLRKLLSMYASAFQDPRNIALHVRSDFEVIIKQLSGEYTVGAEHLLVYHTIVIGLMNRFHRPWSVAKITSTENNKARVLAQQGSRVLALESIPDNRCLVFHPSRTCVPRVSIDGTVISVSTTNVDSGTGAASMIDATFFMSLKKQGGRDCLSQLEDYVSPFSYVRAKEATYFIMGKLLTLSLYTMGNDTDPPNHVELSDVYVVDRLPVPMHIHLDEKYETSISPSANGFTVASFPAYKDHPHWAVENGALP